MRSLFSRAKKNVGKSGSGRVNLQPAEKWAWDNFAFMASSVTELSQDSIGPGEGEAVNDSSDPEEPAPRRKRSRRSATATTDSGAGPSRPILPGSHPSEGSSSENPTHAGRVGHCWGSLCAQMESMFQRLATPNAHFWGAIDWRMRNVSSRGFHDFQSWVWKLADEIIQAEGGQGPSNSQIPDVPGPAGGLHLPGAASNFPSMSAVLQQAAPADDDPLISGWCRIQWCMNSNLRHYPHYEPHPGRPPNLGGTPPPPLSVCRSVSHSRYNPLPHPLHNPLSPWPPPPPPPSVSLSIYLTWTHTQTFQPTVTHPSTHSLSFSISPMCVCMCMCMCQREINKFHFKIWRP